MSDLERQLPRVTAENKQLRDSQRVVSLAPAGAGPHDPDVEARLAAVEARMNGLEGRMDRLESRLEGLDIRLRAVEQGLATLNGKTERLLSWFPKWLGSSQVVGKLPSWWQMPAVIGSTVTVLVALYAAVQYLHAQGRL